MPDRYTVATDGACKGNPGPAGWAWVGESGHSSAGSLPQGTNNIGELLAVLYAINDHLDVKHLLIQADSMYAIDTYTKWIDGHRRRGWKTSAGAPAKNREILEQLIAARSVVSQSSPSTQPTSPVGQESWWRKGAIRSDQRTPGYARSPCTEVVRNRRLPRIPAPGILGGGGIAVRGLGAPAGVDSAHIGTGSDKLDSRSVLIGGGYFLADHGR